MSRRWPDPRRVAPGRAHSWLVDAAIWGYVAVMLAVVAGGGYVWFARLLLETVPRH